ncbi:ACT domain-containing protein [Leuconostoc falkenbergense]|uniref:ACT domain-containing protein n=1 Tax=Leuconostoc falkenbergense TaxID=2766470 RepID=UPI0029585E25|nr:ACT domain-containing protein [Leuconostoc falkenbergense]MDV8951498.1 ACT domain-containing protein [Leuconostoc falkenbergense]
MELLLLKEPLTVFQVDNLQEVNLSINPLNISITADEISVVAPTSQVPTETVNREDGWQMFKIEGVLDFSLIGILAKISGVLAKENISIFALSTFNTDYILVKADKVHKAVRALNNNDFVIRHE